MTKYIFTLVTITVLNNHIVYSQSDSSSMAKIKQIIFESDMTFDSTWKLESHTIIPVGHFRDAYKTEFTKKNENAKICYRRRYITNLNLTRTSCSELRYRNDSLYGRGYILLLQPNITIIEVDTAIDSKFTYENSEGYTIVFKRSFEIYAYGELVSIHSIYNQEYINSIFDLVDRQNKKIIHHEFGANYLPYLRRHSYQFDIYGFCDSLNRKLPRIRSY